MNRLDVRALGWVVTRDTCFEITRVALGGRRRISLEALRELGDRWRAVHAAPAVDQAGPLIIFLASQHAAPLSRQRQKAVAEFVECLQTHSPGLYSEQALRNRCISRGRQATVGVALGAILAWWASSEIPIVHDAVLVLFAIACWNLVTAIQLWRTRLLVKEISHFRRSAGRVTHESLAQPADGGLQDP